MSRRSARQKPQPFDARKFVELFREELAKRGQRALSGDYDSGGAIYDALHNTSMALDEALRRADKSE